MYVYLATATRILTSIAFMYICIYDVSYIWIYVYTICMHMYVYWSLHSLPGYLRWPAYSYLSYDFSYLSRWGWGKRRESRMYPVRDHYKTCVPSGTQVHACCRPNIHTHILVHMYVWAVYTHVHACIHTYVHVYIRKVTTRDFRFEKPSLSYGTSRCTRTMIVSIHAHTHENGYQVQQQKQQHQPNVAWHSRSQKLRSVLPQVVYSQRLGLRCNHPGISSRLQVCWSLWSKPQGGFGSYCCFSEHYFAGNI